ncbi:MAG: glycine--tRNA ligase [Candidatus Gracilibacteria bacterium]|nr:glycine--tRNA ligase [Candidatus Gracilibacteria bacterium]
MDHIVSLCKRRGFIYPGSEIYGGFANTYTFGPYGSELRKNIKDLWWKTFVQGRRDMVGIDGGILLHPRAWEASGHVAGFNDAMVDCKNCKARHRADHLIENALKVDAEGLSEEDLTKLIVENDVKCPKCGEKDFTDARNFNLMFKTELSKTKDDENIAYLRPETAQAIFLEFKNVVDTTRVKVPFGIGQIGKAFRNEITPGNFIFRLIEFEQMEIEYFIRPENWEPLFEEWLQEQHKWCEMIGLNKEKVSEYEHPQDKLSHYSKRTVDIMYDFPFGRSELYGLAYRTDFDLTQHQEYSGKKLEYRDPQTNETYIPHVLEPTWGVDRSILAVLCDAYHEEQLEEGDSRIVMKFAKCIAPVKVAVMPLMKKDGLPEKAQEIYDTLSQKWNVEYDDGGSIGKRYRRQDEIGTPFCITVDYETIKEDDAVTVRDRDSMQQERVKIEELGSWIEEHLL